MMTSSSPPQTTIRSWTYSSRGPSHRKTLSLTLAKPYPVFPPIFDNKKEKEEEYLLIKTAYAALNPADAVLLTAAPRFFFSTPSSVPAFDFTGTVISVYHPRSQSESESGIFKEGSKVIVMAPLQFLLKTGSGGLQEVISVPARYCVPLPESETLLSGAGLFLTGLTSDIVVRDANLKKGDRVLVVGASGGCGTMAVQLARNAVGEDGYVVGVCSGRNEEMVRGIGCDEVIDYTQFKNDNKNDLSSELEARFGSSSSEQSQSQPQPQSRLQFDAVIDAYGNQSLYKNCRRFLKPSGVYSAVGIHSASYAPLDLLRSAWTIILDIVWPRSTWLGGTGRTFKITSMNDPSLEDMNRIAKLFAEGKLRVVRDSVWKFDEVKEAFDVLVGGHAAGKVVVKVSEDDGDE